MLRNAFDLLATEGTLRSILRAVSFSKDLNDRMRVVIDNSALTVNPITLNAGSATQTMQGAAQNPSHWGATSWNLIDDRWEFGNGLNGVFQNTRSRWTF